MPERVQRSRARGWRKPDGAIIVTRPSRWGNPYRIGILVPPQWVWDEGHWVAVSPACVRADTAEDSVRRYRELARQPAFVADARRELGGRDLCCWCAIGQPCHADVLLEISNGGA